MNVTVVNVTWTDIGQTRVTFTKFQYKYSHFVSRHCIRKVPFSGKTRTYLFYIVDIMGADVLATQGARASATMTLIMLDRINPVPERYGLRKNQ